jgi:hypothetical protein
MIPHSMNTELRSQLQHRHRSMLALSMKVKPAHLQQL